MSRKGNISLIIITLLAVAVGVMCGVVYTRFTTQREILSLLNMGHMQMGMTTRDATHTPNKLESTMRIIDSYYVDSIGVDTLIEPLMTKLIGRLDPHSAYIPAEDMPRYNEALDGEFDGIGVVFNMATDTVVVLSVVAGGASSRVGVMARDRIIKINDTLVAGEKVSQEEIMLKLRGKRGTKVKLGIERRGMDDLLDIEVIRDKVPIHSVSASFMIAPEVGYLRLDQFSRTTYNEFILAATKLKREGMQRLIFDLRGNAGGFLDQAILLAGEFLPRNALIVYTEDRSGRQDRQYNSNAGSLQGLDVSVLIDEGSASSSEILAGALQDNDVGEIIGRRSFGKGLIQQQIPFPDGSAIRLTVARYYTPTGRSIQRPYEMGSSEEYHKELFRRLENEELYTADSILFVDSLRHITPGGRVVYGGGGIMPDIFVPLSRDSLPEFYREVAQRSTLYNYITNYSDQHRDELAKVTTLKELKVMFEENATLFDDFVAYAESHDVKCSKESVDASRDIVEHQLRAFIGRNTPLGEVGYYANIYPIDDVLKRAVVL